MNWETSVKQIPQSPMLGLQKDRWTNWTQQQYTVELNSCQQPTSQPFNSKSGPEQPKGINQSSAIRPGSLPPPPPLVRHGQTPPLGTTNTDVPSCNPERIPGTSIERLPYSYGPSHNSQTGSRHYETPAHTSNVASAYQNFEQTQQYGLKPQTRTTQLPHSQYPQHISSTQSVSSAGLRLSYPQTPAVPRQMSGHLRHSSPQMSAGLRHQQFQGSRHTLLQTALRGTQPLTQAQYMPSFSQNSQLFPHYQQMTATGMRADIGRNPPQATVELTDLRRQQNPPTASVTQSRTSQFMTKSHPSEHQHTQSFSHEFSRPPPPYHSAVVEGYPSTYKNPGVANKSNVTMTQQPLRNPPPAHQGQPSMQVFHPKPNAISSQIPFQTSSNSSKAKFPQDRHIFHIKKSNISQSSGFLNIDNLQGNDPPTDTIPGMRRNSHSNPNNPHNAGQYVHQPPISISTPNNQSDLLNMSTSYPLSKLQQIMRSMNTNLNSNSKTDLRQLLQDPQSLTGINSLQVPQCQTGVQSVSGLPVEDTSLIRSAFMLPSRPIPAEADDKAMLGRWYAQPSPEKCKSTDSGLRLPTASLFRPNTSVPTCASDSILSRLVGTGGNNENLQPGSTSSVAEHSIQTAPVGHFILKPTICTDDVIEYKVFDLLQCNTKQSRSRHESSVDSTKSAAESLGEKIVNPIVNETENLNKDKLETDQVGIETVKPVDLRTTNKTEQSAESEKEKDEDSLQQTESFLEENRQKLCDELTLDAEFGTQDINSQFDIEDVLRVANELPSQNNTSTPAFEKADSQNLSPLDFPGLISSSDSGGEKINDTNNISTVELPATSSDDMQSKDNGEHSEVPGNHEQEYNDDMSGQQHNKNSTKLGQKRSLEDDSITQPTKRRRGRARGSSRGRGATNRADRGRGTGRGRGIRWPPGSTPKRGRGSKGGGAARGRGRGCRSRGRGSARIPFPKPSTIPRSKLLDPNNPLLALKEFLKQVDPVELETGTMNLRSVKEILDTISEGQLQALSLTPNFSAVLSAIKNDPDKAGEDDVEMDIADDSTMHTDPDQREVAQVSPYTDTPLASSTNATEELECVDKGIFQSVSHLDTLIESQNILSPRSPSLKLSPKGTDLEENQSSFENIPKPTKVLVEELKTTHDNKDCKTEKHDSVNETSISVTTETDITNSEINTHVADTETQDEGSASLETMVESASVSGTLVQSVRVSATHHMTWVRFHGKTATYLINPSGKFFILTELLRRCFRIEGPDKKKKRTNILDIKKRILKIPDRKLESIFYDFVVTNLKKRGVIRTVPAQFAIISESEACMLFHFLYKKQFCNPCVVPFSSKKDTSVPSSNSQATSAGTSKTQQLNDPLSEKKHKVADLNLFDSVKVKQSPTNKKIPTKDNVVVIDLCDDGEINCESDGYASDTTLPYVDGKPVERLKEFDEEKSSGKNNQSNEVKEISEKKEESNYDESDEVIIIIDEETEERANKDTEDKVENINNAVVIDVDDYPLSPSGANLNVNVKPEKEKPVSDSETERLRLDSYEVQAMQDLTEKLKELEDLCNGSEFISESVSEKEKQDFSTENSLPTLREDITKEILKETDVPKDDVAINRNEDINEDVGAFDRTRADTDNYDVTKDVVICGESPADDSKRDSANENKQRAVSPNGSKIAGYEKTTKSMETSVIDIENEGPPELEMEIRLDEDIMIVESDIPLLPMDCDISDEGPVLFMEAEKKLQNCIERANKAKNTSELTRVCQDVVAMTEPLQNWTKVYLNQYEQGLTIEAHRLKLLEQLSLTGNVDLADTDKYMDIETSENPNDRDNGD